jgi:hypothetical protein
MKNTFLGVVLIFLVACGSTPSKEGGVGSSASAKKSVNTKVVLQNTKLIDGDKKHSLMFLKVGKKPLKVGAFTTPNKAKHIVNAGRNHVEMEVTYTGKNVYGARAAFFVGDIDLAAGQTYTMYASENKACITMELRDSDGLTVFGPISRLHFATGSSYLYQKLKEIHGVPNECK